MPSDKTINTILKYSVYIGLLLVLFVPMVVNQSMFFLYITGKAYAFRILVEVIFALWLILAFRDRSYIPRRSWIFGAVSIFTLIVLVADLSGVEPMRSIWSNYERMEGFIWIAHLFLYFISAAGIMGHGDVAEKKKLWAIVAHVSLFVSLIVGIHGLGQLSGKPADFRIDSYLGNSTYLGVYALVHFFIALYFWMKNAYRMNEPRFMMRLVGYSAIALFSLRVMYQTGTRGSLVGFVAGLGVVALMIAIFDRAHRVMRNTGIGILVLVIVTVLSLGAAKNTDFVTSHPLLARFSALATFDVKGVFEKEGHARMILWGIAYQGFLDHPVLGWGQDNFGYVFAKHYDPRMYDQESWFDRTHNVILDWLIAGGLLGLLSYLSLFVAVLYLLWKKDFELYEKTVITGLLVAYFVHNLFVFDNLSSYILFFSLLVYVHSMTAEKALIPGSDVDSDKPLFSLDAVNYIVTPIIVVVFASAMYFVNASGIKANFILIDALTSCSQGKFIDAEKQFRDTLDYVTYDGLAETREQLLFCAGSAYKDQSLPLDVKKAWITDAMNAVEDQSKATPNDSRSLLLAGSFFKSLEQYDLAVPYLARSIASAPGKQQGMTLLGLIYLNAGQVDKGLDLFAQMHASLPDNKDLSVQYASALIFVGKEAEAEKLFGATSSVMTDDQIIRTYESKKMPEKVLEIYRIRAAAAPDDVKAAILPGLFYLRNGDKESAIIEFRALKTKFPNYAKDLDTIIELVKAGKDPFAQQ